MSDTADTDQPSDQPSALSVTDADGAPVTLERLKEMSRTRNRRYRVLLPLTVSVASGAYTQDEEFEQEFTSDDEWTNVDSGLLGILPERYEVIGGCEIEVNLIEAPASRQRRSAQPGETFEAAIPLAREAQLCNHIRRVQPPADSASPGKE